MKVSFARADLRQRRERLSGPVSERGLDRRACVQRSEHDDRGDRRAGELGSHIVSDAG